MKVSGYVTEDVTQFHYLEELNDRVQVVLQLIEINLNCYDVIATGVVKICD